MAISRTTGSDNVNLWNEFLGLDPERRRFTRENPGELRDRIFKELDKNEDEILTRKDLNLDHDQFKIFDEDSDGKLTRLELKKALTLHNKVTTLVFDKESKDADGNIVSFTRLLDSNKDGGASGEEVAEALPEEWTLRKNVTGKVRLGGKLFASDRQALLYAIANMEKVSDALVENASTDPNLLKNITG